MLVTLKVYDSAGLLLRQVAAGSTGGTLAAVNLSASPYDPSKGPLLISQGNWAYAYDGLDADGAVLRNGVDLLVLDFEQGGSSLGSYKTTLRVLGEGATAVTLWAGPNPAAAGWVRIDWTPAQPVELRVHGMDGELVRDFGVALPPLTWNLTTAGGSAVAPGLYLVEARVPGQRSPRFFKLAVTR